MAKVFGYELVKALHARSMMERDLVDNMRRMGNGVTRQYVNLIVHSKRTPPPELIEKICDAMKVARDDRQVFHRAAALDSGYRIGAIR
jgi:hypothetical protein